MIPIKGWYGTTDLETTELPDDDFDPNGFDTKLIIIPVQDRFQSEKYMIYWYKLQSKQKQGQ